MAPGYYAQPVSSALQKWFVVGAIILGMGAHWAILQSVAWTGMVISYSQSSSFKEALEKTFDGKHQCRLCKLVKAGQRAEQKQGTQRLQVKLDFFIQPLSSRALFPPCLADLATLPGGFCSSFRETPPTPPPIIG
jgi:hypothetical protein